MTNEELAQHAKQSFDRFGLTPYPAIRIVTDKKLDPNEYARAVRFNTGREEVWIRAGLLDEGDLHVILDHEAAHLKAWREHGENIPVHGWRWQATCRKYALSLKACEEKR